MPIARRGFTLVEVVVAILLIDVGLLALVAASTVLVRQTNELRARSNALRAATNRLQALGAAPCAATAGSAAGPLGMHEEWSVSLLPNGVREVRDSVGYPVGAGLHSVLIRTRLPC